MKRSFVVCLTLLTLAVAIFAANTNFAGTWVLDKSKSEGLPRMMESAENITWVINQNDKQVSVETRLGAGGDPAGQVLTYKLDGTETTAEMGGRFPGKATLKAAWMGEGKILELSTVRNANVQGSDIVITTKEHWELAEGGKVLKVHRTTESPRGTQESKLTFNKK